MSDGGFAGYIYHVNGKINWSDIEPTGYEHAGGQPVDGPGTGVSEAELTAAVARIARQAADVQRGSVMTRAITALHRQHSSDGRPNSYLPKDMP